MSLVRRPSAHLTRIGIGLLAVSLAAACSKDDTATNDHDHDHDSGTGGSGTGGSSTGGAGTGGSSTGGSGTGGSGTGGSTADAGTEDVSIGFRAVVGDKAFDCESTYMGGTPAKKIAPLDFRYFVHDVRLIDGAGKEVPVALTSDGKWQSSEVALLDFENAKGTCANGTTDTNAVVKGTVASGTYAGIVFRVGVPEELNHQNPVAAPSPLNLSALHWDWNYGYKFMRLDFNVAMSMPEGGMGDGGMGMGDGGMGMGDGGGMHMDMGTVLIHIGSTACTGDAIEGGTVACASANRPEIRLDAFDPATQEIVLDYAPIIAKLEAGHDVGGAPGCMSGNDDPECAGVFDALGLNLATGTPKTGQTAFSVKAK